MKIFIELNSKDILSAKHESLAAITGALQEIAAETAAPEPVPAAVTPLPVAGAPVSVPSKEIVQAIPETPVPEPAKEVKTAPEPEPVKEEPAAAVKTDLPDPAPHEEPKKPKGHKKKEEPKKPTPMTKEDREVVQLRLKEIAKEGKVKGIKEIFTKHGVKKFSDIPDSDLEEVMEEAEAL